MSGKTKSDIPTTLQFLYLSSCLLLIDVPSAPGPPANLLASSSAADVDSKQTRNLRWSNILEARRTAGRLLLGSSTEPSSRISGFDKAHLRDIAAIEGDAGMALLMLASGQHVKHQEVTATGGGIFGNSWPRILIYITTTSVLLSRH